MKEEINVQAAAEDGGSVKWMSSKMRMMKKMMVSDHKFEDHQKQQPLSPLGTESTDNSSSNNYGNHSNNTVRVCSDCHTTKTPLWRSGPRGPKVHILKKKSNFFILDKSINYICQLHLHKKSIIRFL